MVTVPMPSERHARCACLSKNTKNENEVEDFPTVGETVTLEWQQNQHNFVITERE